MLSGGYEEALNKQYVSVRERLGPLQAAQLEARKLRAENEELGRQIEELVQRNLVLEKDNRNLRISLSGGPRIARVEAIKAMVASYYGVTVRDLMSARRTANLVRPRQVGFYLAKTMTLRSLKEIGQRFGGRDHTTVLHGIRKIETLRETDPDLNDVLTDLETRLDP